MISSRPYLIRAIYEWIVDNDLTPYFLVNAEASDVTIPNQYIQDGRIVLNVSPQAVRDLDLSNDWVMFNARFGGISMAVSVPPSAVLAVYAKENGRGMVFSEDDEVLNDGSGTEPPDDKPPSSPPEAPSKGRPNLRVVK